MFSAKLIIATLVILVSELAFAEELNYSLRCYHDLNDCTLIESIPFDLQLDSELGKVIFLTIIF